MALAIIEEKTERKTIMKYVLVTGAGGGMGKASVQALKNAGYAVLAMDLAPIAAEEHIFPIQADVTSDDSLEQALAQVRAITEELYAIVHFAGIYVLDSLVEMDSAKFSRAFDVNVFGAFRVNKTFLPLLRNGSRVLITTSELAPLDPLPFTGLYAITKSSLDKYAFSLRMELQLKGISVSVLRPGAVKTGMLSVSTAQLDNFCQHTKLYTGNAKRFQQIVDAVEARNIPPERIAEKTIKILQAKQPRYVYALNRNPLLLLMHLLPPGLQTRIIQWILK